MTSISENLGHLAFEQGKKYHYYHSRIIDPTTLKYSYTCPESPQHHDEMHVLCSAPGVESMHLPSDRHG